MAFGRRSYNLRTRHDSVQQGLGALERGLETGIRTTNWAHKKVKTKMQGTPVGAWF